MLWSLNLCLVRQPSMPILYMVATESLYIVVSLLITLFKHTIMIITKIGMINTHNKANHTPNNKLL